MSEDVIRDAFDKYLGRGLERMADWDAEERERQRQWEEAKKDKAAWLAWRKKYARDINFWVTRRKNELFFIIDGKKSLMPPVDAIDDGSSTFDYHRKNTIIAGSKYIPSLIEILHRFLPSEYFLTIDNEDKIKAPKLLVYCVVLQEELNKITRLWLPAFQEYIEARTKRASDDNAWSNIASNYRACSREVYSYEDDKKYNEYYLEKLNRVSLGMDLILGNTGKEKVILRNFFPADVMDDKYLKVCFLFAATLIVRASAMYRVLSHVTDELRGIFDRNGLPFDLRTKIFKVLGEAMDNFATEAPYLAATHGMPLWKDLDDQDAILAGINAMINGRIKDSAVAELEKLTKYLEGKTPESISQALLKAVEEKDARAARTDAEGMFFFEAYERIVADGGKTAFEPGP